MTISKAVGIAIYIHGYNAKLTVEANTGRMELRHERGTPSFMLEGITQITKLMENQMESFEKAAVDFQHCHQLKCKYCGASGNGDVAERRTEIWSL